MKESPERIQFIAEYISAYESKIALLNSNGLFDAAKLFELFAIEVGSLYLGQKISNLNIDTYTYPCVDLISEDKQICIQVSTVKDIPAKIKATLEKIRDSEREDIKAIKTVKFFVLDNESVEKVKDRKGKSQIGGVSFSKLDDLITTSTILQRATNDLDFQIALYELLQKEANSVERLSRKLSDELAASKILIEENIDCKINGEYEIDRSTLISTIIADNHKNISIQGGAGSGKSVLCKKLLQGEGKVLFARAERFGGGKRIEDIWGFSVSEVLERIGNKPIVFFIDALEFIADVRERLDLLTVLYGFTKNYPNARIITSCRTSDKKAFLKLENNFSINVYEISDLSFGELLPITKKYDIIKKMVDMNSYSDLLKSPFYINLIASKIDDIDNISDESQLRDHIWNSVICLDKSKYKKIIKKIVFSRAKEFSLGVNVDDFDAKIIDALVSKEVLIKNDNTVRLKYDIFEDICFEQYFDEEFAKCKGKYDQFFKVIEDLGRCIYRRYQIWISNKLLAKASREKFLAELVFSDKMPVFWQKQTIIGIVKSRHCGEFFDEYEQSIIHANVLVKFISSTNLYGFEVKNDFMAKLLPSIQLRPHGRGRGCLINLIAKNKLHEIIEDRANIEKLCADYAKSINKETQESENACLILQHSIEKLIKDSESKNYYKLGEIINDLLEPIYTMAEFALDWIIKFWGSLIAWCKEDGYERLAKDIIEETLAGKNSVVAKHLPKELCALAEVFWTFIPQKKRSRYGFDLYHQDRMGMEYRFGLNIQAENYGRSSYRSTAFVDNFFTALFSSNFWVGLDWAITFINKTVTSFAEKDQLYSYEIYFVDEDLKREYFGCAQMWAVTANEYNMPLVISDLIYLLKANLRTTINNKYIDVEKLKVFLQNVKKRIYEKSNNIMLLTIISEIGMEFQEKIPGFALDLATNVDIILTDLSRYVQSMISIGDRYNADAVPKCNLREYVRNAQIYYDQDIREKTCKILDYLYSITPNDEENANHYLQIEHMDVRKATAVKIDENTFALVSTPSGAAKKMVEEHDKEREPDDLAFALVRDAEIKVSDVNVGIIESIELIKKLLDARRKIRIASTVDKAIIALAAKVLKEEKLSKKDREYLCVFWISGIETLMKNGIFIFDYSHLEILLFQVNFDISKKIKEDIKELMIALLIDKGNNGIIRQLSTVVKAFLSLNENIAVAMFNTIFKLAEDEMNHQKFNAAYLEKSKKADNFEFIPNATRKLKGVDLWIEESKDEEFQSQADEIVQKFLHEESELDASDFNIDNYDITTLCYALNCGLRLSNKKVQIIIYPCINAMIKVWKECERSFSHEILNFDALYEVLEAFQRELLSDELGAEIVLKIMFEGIDFSKFPHDAIKFYLDVFGELLSYYFDAHSDKSKRDNCVKLILMLEKKIESVKNEAIKKELYKSLILARTSYGGGGDWSKCPSGYSYQDKEFLNSMFSKYGGYHLKEMLQTIYKLHYSKLLPEILLSLRDAFKFIVSDKNPRKKLSEIVWDKDYAWIVKIIITSAFMEHSKQIKENTDLTEAFEEILEMLVDINLEEAAIILDEFRIH